MEVENDLSSEGEFIFQIHHEFNCGFVVQDHLGLGGILPLGRFSKLDKPLGIEQ